MRTSRLRVTLRDVEPRVIRIVDVPASTTLPELHHLLQAAVGWTDSHLHQFVAGELTYGVLGPGDDQPGCRYGEGDCPPEDCGGPSGHAELLDALADPAHPDYARMREWAGEPAPFDQTDTDQLVRQVVGTVPASVRLVLDLAAGGVRLTPGCAPGSNREASPPRSPP